MAFLDDLDMTPRYAPDRVLKVVRTNPIGGRYFPVDRYLAHPPGRHPAGCPLIAECTALELQTAGGSSWYGCARAYINSELRMVVVGTPARDEVRMKWAIVPEDCRS